MLRPYFHVVHHWLMHPPDDAWGTMLPVIDPGLLRLSARWQRARGLRGAHRAASLVRIPDGKLESAIDDGLHFILEPAHEPIDRELYVWGSYEPGTLGTMRRLLRPGDTFLDIGANHGLMTCVAAQVVGPTGHVIAWEPSGGSFALLTMNVGRNGFRDRVTLVRKAAGGETGEQALYYRPEFGTGGATMVPTGREPDEVVEVGRIDDHLDRHPISMMKVDVEGFELDALTGAQRMLREDRPIVCMEYTASQPHAAEAAALLVSLGYEAWMPEGGKRAPVAGELQRLTDYPEHDNVWFMPHAAGVNR